MTNSHIPTPKDIVALLAQNGVQTSDKNAFVQAFKTFYPTLSAKERAELLADLLAYADSVFESDTLSAAA